MTAAGVPRKRCERCQRNRAGVSGLCGGCARLRQMQRRGMEKSVHNRAHVRRGEFHTDCVWCWAGGQRTPVRIPRGAGPDCASLEDDRIKPPDRGGHHERQAAATYRRGWARSASPRTSYGLVHSPPGTGAHSHHRLD